MFVRITINDGVQLCGGHEMKNKTISGIALAILGALISITPRFLICPHCISMGMRCLGTAKTELGVGILIVLLALFFVYFKSREIRLGISLSLALIGIFSVLVPTMLIGVCNGSCGAECTCNAASSLITAILGVLVMFISFVNFMILNKKS